MDMERHAGIESLIGWIKRECLDEIKGAQTWQALHQVMHDNGLELRERANGLVIEAGDGTMVKASTLARELSKPKLEARLGSFEASPERQKRTKAKRQYQKNPVRMRVNTTELYAKYRGDQQTLASAQRAALEKAKQHKARKIEQAKKSSRLRRAVIKLMGDGRFAKKLLYAQAHHALRTEIDSINKRYQKDRQNCYDKHKRRTWADWLKKEALQGNSEALAALRSREAAQTLKGNTMQGKGKAKPARAPEVDNITKKGTIIFRAGKTAVRDDGNRLQVSREATREGLQEALRMAMQRYGPRITVTGTVEFKAQIIRAAVDSRLPISFADPALESRRQALLNKESIHARQDGQDRGRTGRGPSDAGRRPVAHDNTARLNAATRTGSGRGVASGSANYGKRKTNIGRIGRNPPQKNQHHLRTLSQLGVVQIGGGSEVLLPRDVRDHVEQQGTKPTHELRRDIHRSGSGVKHKPEQLAAMDKYIAEREDKRLKGFDIMKHSRYTAGGELTFAGTRKVDGQMLALLKRNDEILVLPIDGQTERKMKRIAIGEEVSIQKGAIKTKGKSR